jgi:HAD superfamily hydrolase (TIGR01509 family)
MLEKNGRVIEAVVFDLDGVLIDSEPVWEQVRRAYVAEHGGRWPGDAQDRLMGMSTPEWARYLTEEAEVDQQPEEVATAVVAQMAGRYAQELPLIPGALEALGRLGARWPLGLASSAPRSLIDSVLATADLTHRFAVTVSTEEVAQGKPAPDVYRAAVDGLALPPARCAAVEDSTNGLLAAAAAGLLVIAVPRPRYLPSVDALSRARVVAANLDELTLNTIEGLDG